MKSLILLGALLVCAAGAPPEVMSLETVTACPESDTFYKMSQYLKDRDVMAAYAVAVREGCGWLPPGAYIVQKVDIGMYCLRKRGNPDCLWVRDDDFK